MKKLTIILAILMATSLAKAQDYTYDSLVNLDFGWYGFDIRNFLELRDGSIVSHSPFYIIDDNGHYVSDLGDMLTKVSPNACFLDSTLMVSDFTDYCLIEWNPQSDDNLFVKIVRDFENLRTNLLIRRFDDNLTYDETQDIVVPLEDTIVMDVERYLLENEENIVLMYALQSGPDVFPITPVMVRMGLDGTIKDRVELPETVFGTYTVLRNLQVYNESPLEYAWSQTKQGSNPTFGYYVVDSLFRLKDYVHIEASFEPDYTMNFSGENILPLDEHSYLVFSRFKNIHAQGDNGVRITKYDKTSHEKLCSVRFATKPQGPNSGFITCAIPVDLKKSADGNLYFVYNTADPIAPSGFYVGVAKLDNNLNVIWHRYCLYPGFNHMPNLILSLSDGGLVVGGYEKGSLQGHISPKLFYLFFHEDGTSVSETEVQVRPYLFYPNPAKDQLHLQYSLDVQPKTIELYDLQGRLVCTQSKGLESVDMQGLAPGQYLMKVTLEDGMSYSDMVVKE